jgi:hypothetical protein
MAKDLQMGCPCCVFMNTARMNHSSLSWREDLKLARSVTDAHRVGFERLLGWFEGWRIGQQLEPRLGRQINMP